jgi:hypothetical protein
MKRATTPQKSRTDLALLRKKTDEDIVRDRDTPEWTREMFARPVTRKGLKPVGKKSGSQARR